jgi:ferredoxin
MLRRPCPVKLDVTVSSNRNQHFVARHYLRRFSFDDGKRIQLFNLASEKYIPKAPLKNQCAADYFYTKDLRGESTLTEIEGIAEDIFKRICDTKDIPESHLDLVTILSLMHSRTKRKADLDSDFIELAAKRTIRCSPDRQSVELVPMLDQVRLQDRAAGLRLVKMSLRYPHLLYDLDLRIIIAPEGRSFVTSDDQCIDCDLCRETAPANFTRSDDGGYSYVFKQPTTPEEEALCKEAMGGCPVEAIGNNGEG